MLDGRLKEYHLGDVEGGSAEQTQIIWHIKLQEAMRADGIDEHVIQSKCFVLWCLNSWTHFCFSSYAVATTRLQMAGVATSELLMRADPMAIPCSA